MKNLNIRRSLYALILAGSISLCGCEKGNINENYIVEELTNDDENTTKKEDKSENIVKEEETFKLDYDKVDVVIATSDVNIREDLTTSSNVVGLLREGNTLKLVEKMNDWYKVLYNGNYCYISSDYADITTNYVVKNEPIKQVYFIEDSYLFAKNEIPVKKYETALVYYEEDENYIASVGNNIGFINKNVVEDLNDKHVVVDISDQKLSLYDGAKEIFTSPVVTGKPSTPTDIGAYSIFEISHNRDLIGEGYRSYVDVMMKFNGGEGLHDAEYHTDYDSSGRLVKRHGWRDINNFGGKTYLSNGSHGCVNMPHDAAIEVSENVEIGTKVLIKE